MASDSLIRRVARSVFSLRGGRGRRTALLVENSPLRVLDPRTKLFLSLCASLAVMLPLERLALFSLGYFFLLFWARLLPAAARQVWRLRWVLLGLFALDWWLISLELAVIVCLRLVLLAGVFSLFFATTTFGEFRLALEHFRVPYRFAFSLGQAFQSLNLLEEEWRAIREAQRSRGILPPSGGLRALIRRLGDWVALTVPAVVLATRRAWAITEAAYARGFDSPHRRPFHALRFSGWDLLAFVLSLLVIFLLFWRNS